MTNRMISATDALFTLNSSLEQHTSDNTSSAGGADGVTGVCFVRDPTTSTLGPKSMNHSHDESDGSGSSNDDSSDCENSDDQPLQFRCSNLLLGPQHPAHTDEGTGHGIVESYQHATHLSAASHNSLSGAFLASCHQDGSCKLWDLATRRCIVNDICQEDPRGGAGLALRRLGIGGDDASDQFLYQTRDPFGTVSLHDMNRPRTPLLQMHTYSTSFCAMSPCHVGAKPLEGENIMGGARNLVALPTEEHSVAVVRDLRCDPQTNPAWRVAVGDENISTMYGTRRKYGMLTSLALCLQESTQRIVLGCGMENGSALFYDLGAMGNGRRPWWIESSENGVKESNHNMHGLGNNDAINASSEVTYSDTDSRFMCSATLGKDPLLCLDLVSSYCQDGKLDNMIGNVAEREDEIELKRERNKSSLVAVGGCAGDADEQSELPEHEQGTLSTIKVKLASNASTMKASIRSKTRTCSVTSGGKVGVSICRFRPDGRVFAVGGWDRRLRIYGRTSSKPLAVLRGHEDSVTAADWASNAAVSGLMATGAGDGRICIWRVFPHSTRS